MKRPLVGALALVLACAALVAPAGARRKPGPSPTDRTFVLVNRNPVDTPCGAENLVLALTPGESNVSCGFVNSGPINTVRCAPELGPARSCTLVSYNAAEGLPLVLDASRPISGTIYVRSFSHPDVPVTASAGPTTLHLEVRGTADGQEQVLGTFTADYEVSPTQDVYEVPFEVDLADGLDRAKVTAFGIDLWNTGAAVMHAFYMVNESNVVVPAWGLAADAAPGARPRGTR